MFRFMLGVINRQHSPFQTLPPQKMFPLCILSLFFWVLRGSAGKTNTCTHTVSIFKVFQHIYTFPLSLTRAVCPTTSIFQQFSLQTATSRRTTKIELEGAKIVTTNDNTISLISTVASRASSAITINPILVHQFRPTTCRRTI